MIKFLLDTDILSEPLKPSPNPKVMNRLKARQSELATAAPVWHELHYGCRRLSPSRKRELIEAYLMDVVRQSMDILPYDVAAAAWHAEQRANLFKIGKSPSFVDGQIAAIAKVSGLVLVTRNIADFDIFSGLDVQNWFE